MVAASHTFSVEKGADVSWLLSASNPSGVHVDHTGYTVNMHVKDSFDSSSSLLDLTTGNGRVTINGSGDIVFTLSSALTSTLSFDRGVYTIKITDGGGLNNFYLTGNFLVRKTAG
jgi:hypothetical protein